MRRHCITILSKVYGNVRRYRGYNLRGYVSRDIEGVIYLCRDIENIMWLWGDIEDVIYLCRDIENIM